MILRRIAWALLIACIATPAGWARADHDEDDRGRGHSKHGDEQGDDDDGGGRHEHFSAGDRRVVQVYFADEYKHGRCPPGLAKKQNGCQPPGHAKKRHYEVGRVLPPRIVVVPVPVVLAERLGPPPYGYHYAMIDGDLVKLAVGTSMVIDAIHGLAQ